MPIGELTHYINRLLGKLRRTPQSYPCRSASITATMCSCIEQASYFIRRYTCLPAKRLWAVRDARERCDVEGAFEFAGDIVEQPVDDGGVMSALRGPTDALQ